MVWGSSHWRLIWLPLLVGCAMDVRHDENGYFVHESYVEHDHGVEVGSSAQAAYESEWWRMPANVASVVATQHVHYDADSTCIGNGVIHPGIRTVTDYISRHFGGISEIQRNSYCKNVAGSSSASIHSNGRAVDILIPTLNSGGWGANNASGDPIAHWLLMNAEILGVQMVVWDWGSSKTNRGGVIHSPLLSRGSPRPAWQQHMDHIHVEFTKPASQGHTHWFTSGGPHRSPWATPEPPTPPAPEAAPPPPAEALPDLAPPPPTFKAALAKTASSVASGTVLSGTIGEAKTLEFAFKNTGTGDWGANDVKLMIAPHSKNDVVSQIHADWTIGKVLRVATTRTTSGQTKAFRFNLQLPSGHTGLRTFVGLMRDVGESREWLVGGPGQTPIYFDIAQPIAAGTFDRLSDTDPNGVVLKGTAGDARSVSFAFRNTGQEMWHPSEVSLVLAPRTTDDDASAVRTGAWATTREIAKLATGVAPLEVARFDFDATLPAGRDGLRVFVAMRRVHAGKTTYIAGGPGQTQVYFDIDQPAWAGAYEEQESMERNGLLLSGYANETHTVSFAFRNVGGQTWNPEEVKLVLADPTPEDVYGIQTDAWLSSNELTTVSNATAPGEVADLSFKVRIPDGYDHLRLRVGVVYERDGKQHWIAGGVGHTPLFFELVRLEPTSPVLDISGKQTVALLDVQDGAPIPEVGEVQFAGELAYEHEGISGSCQVRRRNPGETWWVLGLLLGLIVARQGKSLLKAR